MKREFCVQKVSAWRVIQRMKPFHPRNALAFAILCAVFASAPCSRAGGEFRRFPETVSPDGSYVLGWGAREHAHDELASLKDVSANREKAPDSGAGDDWENYLVDAASGRVVAVIPGFHYFSGPEGNENHRGISAAWSPGARSALAIYDGRWSYEAIAWIDLRERHCVSVGKQLEAAFRQLLLAKEKSRDAGSVSFHGAVLPKPDTLVVEASAEVPKSESAPYYHYRLKFRVSSEGGKVRVELLKSHSISDQEETADAGAMGTDEEAETELNKVYGKLRATLSDADRESLKTEEKKWLSLREAMPKDNQLDFTRHRVGELRVRADDW
jgi:uncharacterized protein YecT (DUF1311 family)